MTKTILTVEEIESSLENALLAPWFPACVSPRGGFHQSFAADWTPEDDPHRFLVFQARMTWLAATVAEASWPHGKRFAEYARHGVRFLADAMADPESGAFAWHLGADGKPVGRHGAERHAYGLGFAIYGLAAAARALRSEEALEMAQGAFAYLERHHHDSEHRGYFEVTDPAGTPILDQDGTDGIGTPYGWKSQNTHLHLLEAFTELYRVWPDGLVAERLNELLDLFLGPLYAPDGWLHVYAGRNWRPIPGNVSHGHDIEAAHLIVDAARILGRLDVQIVERVRGLADYALANGWHAAGGFFYSGTPAGEVVDDTKRGWVQAEGLLGLATLYDLTSDPLFAHTRNAQWRWIRDHQIDPIHGGWHEAVAPDGTPVPPTAKGHAWKAAYHDGRALLFTARLLRSRVYGA
jgi:mannobiose 2-epimerase